MRYLLLISLLFVGCAKAEPVDFLPIILTSIGPASLDGSTPSPAPTPSKYHKRADCPTDGWITQGDGHQTRCKYCQPSYSDYPEGGALTPDLRQNAEPAPPAWTGRRFFRRGGRGGG